MAREQDRFSDPNWNCYDDRPGSRSKIDDGGVKSMTGYTVNWQPFDTYPLGREVLYFVPSYESYSELVGRKVKHPARMIVMTLLRRQTFNGPAPTHWSELPLQPEQTSLSEAEINTIQQEQTGET